MQVYDGSDVTKFLKSRRPKVKGKNGTTHTPGRKGIKAWESYPSVKSVKISGRTQCTVMAPLEENVMTSSNADTATNVCVHIYKYRCRYRHIILYTDTSTDKLCKYMCEYRCKLRCRYKYRSRYKYKYRYKCTV